MNIDLKNFGLNDTLAIKGIAILLMYVHHNFLDPGRWGRCVVDFWPLTQSSVVSIAVYCKICVSLFVFLSGLGLTIKYKQLKEESSQFLNKFVFNRLYKLELNFLFIFVLAWLYAYVMGLSSITKIYGKGEIKSFLSMLVDSVGLADLFNTPTFNATWWYMNVAIAIILFFPVIYWLYKKFGGIGLLVLSIMLPIALRLPYSHFFRYLPCLVLGIIFADKNLLPYIRKKLLEKSKFRNFLITCVLLALAVFLAQKLRPFPKGYFIASTNVLSVAMIVIFSFTYLNQKYIWSFLAFLGKHSMNMFFTHTFLRAYWYHDFIYSFKYAWLDTLVLLVITVLLSMCIEQLKNLTGFRKLLSYKI